MLGAIKIQVEMELGSIGTIVVPAPDWLDTVKIVWILVVEKVAKVFSLAPPKWQKGEIGTIVVLLPPIWCVLGPSGDLGQSAQNSVETKVQKQDGEGWNKVKEEWENARVKLNRASKLVRESRVQVRQK